jgi:Zn-dependent peptidase ImmA (M78 family)
MTILMLDRIDSAEAEIVKRYISVHPVKVGELAEELGLSVVRAPLPPNISGLIQPSATSRSGFEIKVNKYETSERQRFTVAHEIAHYLLHRSDIGAGVVDSIMYRSSLTSRKETEANKLAADITMPAAAIALELKKRNGVRDDDVASALAGVFRVSLPAMKVRLGIV